MTNSLTRDTVDPNLKPILHWLALSHGQTGLEDALGLHKQLLALRDTPTTPSQRIKLLDLMFAQASKIVQAQLPRLREASLPIPRKLRQLVRTMQDMLEILAQDYINTLAELFDPLESGRQRSPAILLQHAMQCLAWHLAISHLAAAPPAPGIWQQAHSTYRTARTLGRSGNLASADVERIADPYVRSLLLAVAQPASFTSAELEFIDGYIDGRHLSVGFSEQPPDGQPGVFWIDPERDAPAHALARRPPPPDTPVLYFACDALARQAADDLDSLERQTTPETLGLPPFAGTPAGQGILRRLTTLWGHPARRKFPRRRQSYRADLCLGLENLWELLATPEEALPTSAWMVTNESPDGYAMMHLSGDTEQLRVGDIVAVRPQAEQEAASAGDWFVCIVRWALSENPEHIEIGLQVLAPHAVPVLLALPGQTAGTRATALLLPEIPPLRPLQALVVPSGTVSDRSRKLVLLVEQENISIREMRATRLDEQTASIEVFTVEPDETP